MVSLALIEQAFPKANPPANPIAFYRQQIDRTAAKTKFSLYFDETDTSTAHLEVRVKTPKGKEAEVQIFDRLGEAACCSCDKFCTDELSYCVHIATVKNILNMKPYVLHRFITEKEEIEFFKNFRNELFRKIQTLPDKVSDHKKEHETYESLYCQVLKFGKKDEDLPTRKTASMETHLRLKKKADAALPPPMDVSVDDANGILREIELFDYQKDIFVKMLKARRAICALPPGFGKTATTIGAIVHLRKSNPNLSVLVVSPKSLRRQWEREILRLSGLPCLQIENQADLEAFPFEMGKKIGIVTYQFATRHIEKLKNSVFDLVVLDEIQFIRNKQTKTWRAIKQISSNFFFGLSGTVIENSLDDLFHQMNVIHPKKLGVKWKFNYLFQNLQLLTPTTILYSGLKNREALLDKLKDCVFTYDKNDLAPVEHVVIPVQLSSAEKKLHDYHMEQVADLRRRVLNSSEPKRHLEMLIQANLTKARQACNSHELASKEQGPPSSKVREFLRIVGEVCLQKREKLVVFSEWTEMLALLDRHLKETFPGMQSIFFTGAESSKQRDAAVLEFQKNPDCKIFFASSAGGVGLDGLQLVCHHLVHVEPPWNPAQLDQRTARLHRKGQKNTVVAFRLSSLGTIEQRIEEKMIEKREIRTATVSQML